MCVVIRAHEQFGYCQAGTSGVLLDDDSVVIGTPGPYTWRGTIFTTSTSDDFLHRDKTVYSGPLKTEKDSPVDKYSYLGKFAECAQVARLSWADLWPVNFHEPCSGRL